MDRRSLTQGSNNALQPRRVNNSPSPLASSGGGGGSGEQISEALKSWQGAAGQAMKLGGQRAAAAHKAEVERQTGLVDLYTEQFARAQSEDGVKLSQMGEVFPEMVPEVANRVTRALGARDYREQLAPVFEEFLTNDDLRLDTGARQGFYEELREQAVRDTSDNEQYQAGALEEVEKTIATHELNALRETAAYHEEIQRDEFSHLVTEAFMTDGDLEAIDADWAEGSSLNHMERKELVVDAATEWAVTSRDPSVMDRIPTKFLNAQITAQIPVIKTQIRDAMYKEATQANTLKNIRRSEETYQNKLQFLGMLDAGEEINLMDWRHDPDVYDWISGKMSQPKHDATESRFNQNQFKANVLRGAFHGDYSKSFQSDPQFLDYFSDRRVTEDNLREHLLNRTDLNPAETQGLLDELPKLMEGTNLMKDTQVQNALSNHINRELTRLEQSTSSRIQRILTGESLPANAIQIFEDGIHGSYLAHYESEGEAPMGREWREMVSEARKETMEYIKERTRLGGPRDEEDEAAPQRANRRGGSQSRQEAPAREPTEQDVQFLRNNPTPENQERFQNTFGHLPEGL